MLITSKLLAIGGDISAAALFERVHKASGYAAAPAMRPFADLLPAKERAELISCVNQLHPVVRDTNMALLNITKRMAADEKNLIEVSEALLAYTREAWPDAKRLEVHALLEQFEALVY